MIWPKSHTLPHRVQVHAALFVLVLLGCLLGIWTRPIGLLASIWPANALMLGFMLRVPQSASVSGWLTGAAAFLTADLLTGSGLLQTSILSSANLISIWAAYLILSRASDNVLGLRHPISMLYLLLASAIGGAAAGLVGMLANPYLFGGSMLRGFTFWWITEVVNYVAILPIFLTAPVQRAESTGHKWQFRKQDILPTLAVLLSCLAMLLIGGPGAVAFPVLALLWCALVYPVFPTAILTLLCSLLALLTLSDSGFHHNVTGIDDAALFSIRLGAAVVAIAPVMLSIVTNHRNELMAQLRYVSMHDALTGAGNRAAFCQEAERILQQKQHPHAVLMIDLDHFKQVNDKYGHAGGDRVLCEVARRIQSCLRPDDQLGRIGGEEFAVVLYACHPDDAKDIAERIRFAIAAQPVTLSDNKLITVTTSIGVSFVENGASKSLESLLAEADGALYQSKESGRNCVRWWSLANVSTQG
ncbi:GGDEF domain-containing protein [Bowmanella denitrificans]|uniref:GGDEF domain-containing protein n=1 Tax=Bowmanella denitrificans TaxID=366582 RepID=UPI000C99D0C1|nr:GGDEF domain-containing protein [Bowmanella denitrificans]